MAIISLLASSGCAGPKTLQTELSSFARPRAASRPAPLASQSPNTAEFLLNSRSIYSNTIHASMAEKVRCVGVRNLRNDNQLYHGHDAPMDLVRATMYQIGRLNWVTIEARKKGHSRQSRNRLGLSASGSVCEVAVE